MLNRTDFPHMQTAELIQQQNECAALASLDKGVGAIASETGLSRHQVRRRLKSHKKAERLDPHIRNELASKGVADLAGLHSGWLLKKDKNGGGHSLYFHLGPDVEKISFADAMTDALADIPRLPPLDAVVAPDEAMHYANWVFLADLHVGGDYGEPALENDFNYAIDRLVRRLPPAEKAYLMEMGDLLDANDHKGVTPASGNPCDVKRDQHLQNTKTAVRLMKRAVNRLAETHAEVEVHLIKGNHDPSAYLAVLLALEEHYADNPRVTIWVPQDEYEEEYRVVQWGRCACFPHHGHSAKWAELKDVFADQFADEWAHAKAYRLIATAHFHHDRSKDLVGVHCRQFRTLHRANRWAREKGLFSRGSLTAFTVHAELGEENTTTANIPNSLKGRPQ